MIKKTILVSVLCLGVSVFATADFSYAKTIEEECVQKYPGTSQVDKNTQKACADGYNAGASTPCPPLTQPALSACKEGKNMTPNGVPDGASGSTRPADNDTRCDVPGMGWVVCWASKAIAKLTDGLFSALTTLLEVRPLGESTDGGKALRSVWGSFSAFGNVILIVVLLAVILSQVTNVGISNYGIKKLLPRIIVGVVLINISYYICVVVVDLTNIIGGAIQNILMNLAIPIKIPEFSTWSSIVSIGLIGATAAIVFFNIAAIAPMLVTGFFALMATVIFLMVRQAAIIVLIILSPIAFALNILPSTQSWFSKWWKMFLTICMIFPAVAFVFGATQVASGVIAAATPSTGTTTQITFGAFALAVQSVPFFITPLLIKLGGGMMNRLAGVINNPSKGLVDRSRNRAANWANNKQANLERKAIESNPKSIRSRVALNKDKKQAIDKSLDDQLKMGGGGALDQYLARDGVRHRIGNSVARGTGAKDEKTDTPPAPAMSEGVTLPGDEDPGEAPENTQALQEEEEAHSYNTQRAADIGESLNQLAANIDLTAIEAAEVIFEPSVGGDHYSMSEKEEIAHSTLDQFGAGGKLKDGSTITADEKHAALKNIAATGNIEDVHKLLRTMEKNRGNYDGNAFKAVAAGLESNKNIQGSAAHLDGNGVNAIRNGEVSLGNLYASAAARGAYTPETLSKQSTGAVRGLIEVNLNQNTLNKIRQQQEHIDKSPKLQANQSAGAKELLTR